MSDVTVVISNTGPQGVGVPAGGTTGQSLVKLSNTDYATVWSSAGSGTVTSVGLSLPGLFTVSNSPVTGAGTLTAVLATQQANRVLAGPTTGADAAPTFRALVAADLPNTTVTAGAYTYASITVDAQGRLTSAANGTAPVLSVTGTAPIVSSGGTTPALSITAATTSAAGSMSAADKTKLDSITVDSATLVRKFVRNNSGVPIPKGAPVYQTGSSGTTITVALADASTEATASQTLGVAQETIADNDTGYIVAVGQLDGINTSALTEGQIVWLSETAGQLTTTRPTQPAHGVVCGYCVKQAAGTAGILYVKVDNGLELNELHDVLIPGALTGQVLRKASDGLWKNHTPVAADISDSTTAGRALLTDVDAAAQRTSLGLGTLATQSGTFSGTSSGTNSGDVSLAASVADVLDLTGQILSADDPGADRLLFWDDSESKLRHLSLGTNLTITGTVLDAAGGGGSGTPGGSTTQVQFNDAGAFAGDADFTWDKTANTLNVKGSVRLDDAVGTFDTIVQSVPATATRYITFPDKSGLVVLGDAIRTKSVFTAIEAQPPAANFARRDTRNSVPVLEFRDSPTDEATVFLGVLAEGTDVSLGLLVRIWWMADTATTGNVRWAAEFERLVTDLDADSFDTATEVTTTTSGTSGIPVVSSLFCSTIDSLVAGDAYRLRITRRASNTTEDTMTGDAQIVAVEVRGVA